MYDHRVKSLIIYGFFLNVSIEISKNFECAIYMENSYYNFQTFSNLTDYYSKLN